MVSVAINKALHRGLYQGFGPTVVASIPSSMAFFTVYESVKVRLAKARAARYLQGIPQSMDYALASAVAEIPACAIINPAQVLKQNAQVFQSLSWKGKPPRSPTVQVLKQFGKHPSKLWTGYTILVSAQLPCVCLTFSIYELLKQNVLVSKGCWQEGEAIQQVQASVVCGAIAGCCASWAFVPADVVKIRMRIAAGRRIHSENAHYDTVATARATSRESRWVEPKALAIAKEIVRREGHTALFRGSILSCTAAGIGSGIYLGSYEAIKLYCDEDRQSSTI